MAVVQGIMYAAFLIVLKGFVKQNYPIFVFKLFMDLGKIEIQIRGRTYFSENWNKVKGIELTNEKFFERQKERIYRLKILTEGGSREFRFDALQLDDRQTDLILNILNKTAEKHNLKIQEKTARTDLRQYTRDYKKAWEEFRQF